MTANGPALIEDRIRSILVKASSVHAAAAEQSTTAMAAAIGTIRSALVAGGKVLVFGNGGSAADSQHFAAELVGRFRLERRPFSAVALTTDTSVLTSIANDFAFEQVFARQVEALGRAGDVAFAITTSGRSPNVLAALAQAKRQTLTTIALVGSKVKDISDVADVIVAVPADDTARIQEVQRTMLHIICELIEEAIGEPARSG